MRRSFRGLAAALGIAFEANPRLAVLTVISGFFAPVSLFGIAISLKLVVDAAIENNVGAGIIAAVIASISLSAGIAHLPIGASASLQMQEKIGAAVDRRLVSMTVAVPSLELHDRPEYLSKLRILIEERFSLNVTITVVTASAMFAALVIAIGIVLAFQHPLLGLFPLFLIPVVWMGMIGERVFRRAQDSTGEEFRLGQALFNLTVDPTAGKELRIFGLGEQLMSKQGLAQGKVVNALNRASWTGAALQILTWLIFTVAYVAAILVVVRRAANGQATAGDVILTIAIAAPISFIAGSASLYLSLLQRLLSAADRYLWLRDIAAEAARPLPDPAIVPAALTSGIRLDHVGFRYPGTDRPVLSDITLDLPSGSVVALVGENGAGKTTLVKLLCKLYAPSEGQILVDGQDLSQMPAIRWRDRVAAGFQDYCQFEVVAREAVGVGDLPRVSDEAAVRTAIDRAGAADVLASLPENLATQLGREWENGAELSTGQWQKLALARAFMRDDPLLVVLDEPTAALDAAAEHALFERFSEAARAGQLARDRVTLLVSHRFSTVRMADLIVVLDGGRVKELGSHTELMSHGGLYAELYELQARSYR